MLLAPYWVETEAHSKIGVLTMLIGFSILAIILIIIWVCIKLFVKDEGVEIMKKQTKHVDNIECCYCGEIYNGCDACNGESESVVIECPKCGKELQIWISCEYTAEPIEGDQKINIEIKEGGRYYEWNDGFCDYYINEKTGERKFKLDPEDEIVEHKFDDFGG